MMATESFKRCDVTGSRRGVKEYNIVVVEVSETEDDSRPILNVTKDLCPRIAKRLVANIERSLTNRGAPTGKVLIEDR